MRPSCIILMVLWAIDVFIFIGTVYDDAVSHRPFVRAATIEFDAAYQANDEKGMRKALADECAALARGLFPYVCR